MEKTTWPRLDPQMRAELEALLANPTSAWLSDFQDALAWWLLLILVGVGGAGAGFWNIATGTLTAGEIMSMMPRILLAPSYLAPFVGLAVAAWAGITCARNAGRRGYAALSNAIVVVRGPKLRVLRYADIAEVSTRVIGGRGPRFTVLSMVLGDGAKTELNVHGGWAEQVIARRGA